MISMGIPPHKTFKGDFDILLDLLKSHEHFAFSRFSDGEVFMMQGQEIVMAADHCKVKGQTHRISYSEDDYKHYNPSEHEFFRQKLEDAFTHRQYKYFKGLSCRCCIGNQDFQWQLKKIREGHVGYDDANLTWSNVLINANYLYFIRDMVPEFQKYPVILVINKNANLSTFPLFDIKHSFRVGPNCIVNDYDLIDDINEYIYTKAIYNHLFLFAASSLSNMAIHQLYETYPLNTYMDIGSSLNPFIDGIGSRRNYMKQLDIGSVSYKPCVW